MSVERRRWLDDPRNVTRLYRGLWAVGIVLVLQRRRRASSCMPSRSVSLRMPK